MPTGTQMSSLWFCDASFEDVLKSTPGFEGIGFCTWKWGRAVRVNAIRT